MSDGAAQISDGAGQLRDGSEELGDGLDQVYDGSDTLATSLADGAKEVKETKADDNTYDMFSSPVEASETKITTVENKRTRNGTIYDVCWSLGWMYRI